MPDFVLAHHPSAEAHDPGRLIPGHPDTAERILACRGALTAAERTGRLAALRWIRAPAARDEELALVHGEEHIRRIERLAGQGAGRIDPETAVSAATVEAARHAAGAACALVDEVAGVPDGRGMALTRPAGHHAEPDQAMGFCLFNNVAIAAERAIARHGIRRVMIIDWDVHYGNGTAEAFRRRDDVLVAGIHQQGLYPGGGGLADTGSGPGRGFTVNVPVPPGSDEAPTGFVGTRPPGHHCEVARPMGFCLFNNVAIAAQHAREAHGVERVAVFDWDVHHGNGTNDIFHTRNDVLYISIHQSPLYPGSGPLRDVGSGDGEGYTINLPVPPGAGEPIWLSLVEHLVTPILRSFEPGLILVSAGFDAHRADPLAQCALVEDSFAKMATHVRATAQGLGARFGSLLEGGYDLDALAKSVAASLEAFADDDREPEHFERDEVTDHCATVVKQHWPV